jgi:hypothetical protein
MQKNCDSEQGSHGDPLIAYLVHYHSDWRGRPNSLAMRCQNDTTAMRFVHSVIATDASFARLFLQSVASNSAGSDGFHLASVKPTAVERRPVKGWFCEERLNYLARTVRRRN